MAGYPSALRSALVLPTAWLLARRDVLPRSTIRDGSPGTQVRGDDGVATHPQRPGGTGIQRDRRKHLARSNPPAIAVSVSDRVGP